MAIIVGNTGYQGVTKLKKVVDLPGDINDGFDLDVNNKLCFKTGLPVDTKDNNTGDPDYSAPIENLESCPLPKPEDLV